MSVIEPIQYRRVVRTEASSKSVFLSLAPANVININTNAIKHTTDRPTSNRTSLAKL
jgi:hypothetical protein